MVGYHLCLLTVVGVHEENKFLFIINEFAMDFEMISKMKVEELKIYLKLRGLKVSGTKKELISRVFVAGENDVQPILSAIEVEDDLRKSYEKKLIIDGKTIPDPRKIPGGWTEENEGITFWPMVTSMGICTKLMFFPSELSSEDLSDYKECKAYSYFKNGWLQPLQYHNLSGSTFCIIKGQYRPSQNVNQPFHSLWIIFQKSGKIRSCHCTCVAGKSQVCNHVAAALYRIEAAVRNGLTNPACTSKPNTWLSASKKVLDIPFKIKDLQFQREDFGTRGKKKKVLDNPKKKNFQPLQISNPLQLKDIAEALTDIAPDSIVHTAVVNDEAEVDFFIHGTPNVNCCVSVYDIFQRSKNREELFTNVFFLWTRSIPVKLNIIQDDRQKTMNGFDTENVLSLPLLGMMSSTK